MIHVKINAWLKAKCFDHLKPYEILWVSENKEVAVIKTKTGLVEAIPLDAETILEYGGVDKKLWVFHLLGEDWLIILYEGNELHIYYVDNWDLILKGLKEYEPVEVVSLT